MVLYKSTAGDSLNFFSDTELSTIIWTVLLYVCYLSPVESRIHLSINVQELLVYNGSL